MAQEALVEESTVPDLQNMEGDVKTHDGEDAMSKGTAEGVKLTGAELEAALKAQLEYYFSRENLAQDAYLVSQMGADLYVPIAVVSQFKMVRALSEDMDAIVRVLKSSSLVQVDEANERVRPVCYKRTTLILRELADDASETEILSIFGEDSGVVPVSARMDIGNTWFVTFKEEDETLRAFDYVQGRQFKDKPLRARIKSENVLRSSSFSGKSGGYKKSSLVGSEMTTPAPGADQGHVVTEGEMADPHSDMSEGMPMMAPYPPADLYYGHQMYYHPAGYMPYYAYDPSQMPYHYMRNGEDGRRHSGNGPDRYYGGRGGRRGGHRDSQGTSRKTSGSGYVRRDSDPQRQQNADGASSNADTPSPAPISTTSGDERGWASAPLTSSSPDHSTWAPASGSEESTGAHTPDTAAPATGSMNGHVSVGGKSASGPHQAQQQPLQPQQNQQRSGGYNRRQHGGNYTRRYTDGEGGEGSGYHGNRKGEASQQRYAHGRGEGHASAGPPGEHASGKSAQEQGQAQQQAQQTQQQHAAQQAPQQPDPQTFDANHFPPLPGAAERLASASVEGVSGEEDAAKKTPAAPTVRLTDIVKSSPPAAVKQKQASTHQGKPSATGKHSKRPAQDKTTEAAGTESNENNKGPAAAHTKAGTHHGRHHHHHGHHHGNKKSDSDSPSTPAPAATDDAVRIPAPAELPTPENTDAVAKETSAGTSSTAAAPAWGGQMSYAQMLRQKAAAKAVESKEAPKDTAATEEDSVEKTSKDGASAPASVATGGNGKAPAKGGNHHHHNNKGGHHHHGKNHHGNHGHGHGNHGNRAHGHHGQNQNQNQGQNQNQNQRGNGAGGSKENGAEQQKASAAKAR